MELLDCFKYLVDEIHTVVVATVDAQGHPQTRAIDLLGYDEEGLYFSTGAGKAFCRELESQGYVALTGMKGESTMERVAVSVHGQVRAQGAERTEELLQANPYMLQLYPTPESRATVRLFCVHAGSLDWYDLRTTPMTRLSFTFGGAQVDQAARRAALLRNLAGMLALEAGEAVADIPPEGKAQLDLVDRLLAARGDAPMSADLYEAWRLFEDVR